MSPLEQRVTLEGFEYTRVDERRAVLRVLARVSADKPAHPRLRVSRREEAWDSFSAHDECLGSSAPDSDTNTGLIWRGLFTVPVELVHQPLFGFELVAENLPALTLPRPWRCGAPALTTPALVSFELAGATSDELSPELMARVSSSRLRIGTAALATALAVTAGSAPTLAAADAGFALSSHAQLTQERIARHATFAAERAHARARAAGKHARSAARTHGSTQRPVHGGLTGHGAAPKATVNTPKLDAGHSAPSCPPAGEAPAPSKAHARHLGTLTPLAHLASCPPAPIGPPPPTPTLPTVPTLPTTNTPAPNGGAGLGASDSPAPPATAPATTTPQPNSSPTVAPAPPVVSAARPQPTSPSQLPITLPGKTNGGSSVHPVDKRVKRPTVSAGAPTGGSGVTLVPSAPGFLGPRSWTGSVTSDPALTGALGNLAGLLANGNTPPRFLIPIYMEAGRRYHVPWPVLAAINAVESDYGRNLNTSSAGAIGWMQFEPSTWKEYGLAVDGHSVPNPYDPRDAIFSAARYLAAAGAAQDVPQAIYAYNHATWYVDMVLTRARAIAAGIHPHTHTSKRGVVSTYFATWHGHWRARYQGGLLSHYVRLIAAANMVSAANFPYVFGGGHEQPASFGPFDCSGSVSYVLQQAGYKIPTTVSGNVPTWKFPSGPGRVTVFYNPGHTFMRIGNRYFGTSGFARPGGGAGWFSTGTIPESYLAGFSEVHVPRLGANSFAPAKRRRHHRHSSHTAHPGYVPQFSSPAALRPSFPSVLQMRFPSS